MLFVPSSHYCETVAHPDQVGWLTRAAVQNAVGKRGAAVLVLPGDVPGHRRVDRPSAIPGALDRYQDLRLDPGRPVRYGQ